MENFFTILGLHSIDSVTYSMPNVLVQILGFSSRDHELVFEVNKIELAHLGLS